MYVTEIDNLLDKTLDKFMNLWLMDKKSKIELISLATIIKEINFTRYQKEINLLLTIGINLVPESEITSFVTKNNNILLVKNIITRYLAYYILLQIGMNYAGKTKQFNNNLVEFNRAQSSHSVASVDDFFNTTSNANILMLLSIITEFKQFIATFKTYKTGDKNKILSKMSLEFRTIINSIPAEQLEIIIDMLNTKDKDINDHNLIKLLLYKVLYQNEKKQIFDTIESSETTDEEFIFIEIIVPHNVQIDMTTIENILSPQDIKRHMADAIYTMINVKESEIIDNLKKNFINHDDKIQKLFHHKIVIPIVDDFLLYHKLSEKYEESFKTAQNKNENTKIKYIVNKLNNITTYYKHPEEVKQLMYAQESRKNAVLINRYENNKIEGYVEKTTVITADNYDTLNDYNNYMLNAYVPFHYGEKNGFNFVNDYDTITVIRRCSFDGKNKKLLTHQLAQNAHALIVGYAMVDEGAIINDNFDVEDLQDLTMDKKIVEKIIDFVDYKSGEILENNLHDINKTNKKNDNAKNVDDAKQLEDANYNNSFFLFNLEDNDNYNFPNMASTATMNKNELVKIISAQMYDEFIKFMLIKFHQHIKNNKLHNIDLKLQYDVNNFTRLCAMYPDINNESFKDEVIKVFNSIYKNDVKISDYDDNEDTFKGLIGDIIQLPTMPKKIPPNVPKIKLDFDFEIEHDETENNIQHILQRADMVDELAEDVNNEIEFSSMINATCQHRIILQKLSSYENTRNPNYSDNMYAFIQQYIKINYNQDFICKSCGNNVNELKNHVLDGIYNNILQRYEGFSINITDSVEDMPEYAKFRTAIRNVDKIIDRISSIIGMTELSGLSYSARTTRNKLMKNIIDFILVHNEYLNKYYLPIKQKRGEELGINRRLSNLFAFKLDNNIFVFSTTDADSIKPQKYNNIIGYIVIFLIIDMDEIQIMALNNDKRSKTGICSYETFKKNIDIIFSQFKIVINTNGDLDNIINYPVLCYSIFIITCFIVKYNLWANTFENKNKDEDTGKKKSAKDKQKQMFSTMQKSAINTIIELLNSAITADNCNIANVLQKKYLYEIITTKYFIKLPIFKNKLLMKRLDNMHNGKKDEEVGINAVQETTKYDIEVNIKNGNSNKYTVDELYDKHVKPYSLVRQKFPPTKNYYPKVKITNVSNLTNCIDGQFHEFTTKGDNLICKKCNTLAGLDSYLEDSTQLIEDEQIQLYYRRLATKYCQNGRIHDFKKIGDTEKRKCDNCGYIEGNSILLKDKELIKLYDNVQNIIHKNNIHVEQMIASINATNNETIVTIKKVFDKLMYKFHKNNGDISKSIDTFIDSIEELIGINITINDQIYNTRHNIYIINHDAHGGKTNTSIRHYENENKFRVIENHASFNRPVIAYMMQGSVKYELYYDKYSKFLLGYRESGKKIIPIEKYSAKLIINYSVKSMLKLFGFTSDIIHVKDVMPELYGYTEDQIKLSKKEKRFDMNNIINISAMRRYGIIKNLGYYLNKYITRFKYNYKINLQYTFNSANNTYVLNEMDNDPYDIIYNKYHSKIGTEFTVSKDDGKTTHSFLKYINPIVEYLPMERIKDKMEFADTIEYEYIIKYDFTGNLTMNYIMDEINRLISFNETKATKRNITNFILEIMYKMFDLTNYDIYRENKEHYAMVQTLYSSSYFTKMQEIHTEDAIDYLNDDEIDVVDLTDKEIAELANEIEDNKNEEDALDMEDEMDAEDEYGEDYE